MKKTILILGTVYTIVCTGFGIWGLTHPEQYGMWTGKMMNGMIKALEAKED